MISNDKGANAWATHSTAAIHYCGVLHLAELGPRHERDNHKKIRIGFYFPDHLVMRIVQKALGGSAFCMSTSVSALWTIIVIAH